ncbi:MAG TPA: hypothetical protein VIU81_07505 [Gaiellaceae bacterium]
MQKIHILAVALVLGLAAVVGVVAATQTTGIGAARSAARSTARPSDHAIAVRSKKLDSVERALARALKNRPPALPHTPSAGAAAAPAAASQVVYRRPAPVIILKHRAGGGEHEQESESSGD